MQNCPNDILRLIIEYFNSLDRWIVRGVCRRLWKLIPPLELNCEIEEHENETEEYPHTIINTYTKSWSVDKYQAMYKAAVKGYVKLFPYVFGWYWQPYYWNDDRDFKSETRKYRYLWDEPIEIAIESYSLDLVKWIYKHSEPDVSPSHIQIKYIFTKLAKYSCWELFEYMTQVGIISHEDSMEYAINSGDKDAAELILLKGHKPTSKQIETVVRTRNIIMFQLLIKHIGITREIVSNASHDRDMMEVLLDCMFPKK